MLISEKQTVAMYSKLSLLSMENTMTKDPKCWWDSGGINFGMVTIMCSINLLFGPEIMMIQINPEGWLVGVWDSDSWD